MLALLSFGRSTKHCSPGSLALLLTLQWPEFPVSFLCSSEELVPVGDGPSCSFRRGRTQLPIDDEEEDGQMAAAEEHMLLLSCIFEIDWDM